MDRYTLAAFGIVSLLAGVVCAQAQIAPNPAVSLVPRPVEVKSAPGTFLLDTHTLIVADSAAARAIASLFNESLLSQHGLQLQITRTRPRHQNYIAFSEQGSTDLPEEGYRLVVESERVAVIGRGAGLFYGMQTLTQLLPLEIRPAIVLPALQITDYPRFGYRGVLLDVGRHYFSPAAIKKYLDVAAQYKINRFHWHLTDDQAWRIEIRKYPKLTGIGSYVDPTSPGGRYYTQQQIRDILAYAEARFIVVIPEVEMPGHAGAAIAAYPELACAGTGPDNNVLCPSETTFAFLRDVLTEVADLFPSPYIHIGSDEVQKDGWRQSAEAQTIMKSQGLKNEEELQSYFVRRIEQFLATQKKRTIGWDEILEGGLAPNAIVMSWRGEAGGIAAVNQNHQAIMTPSEYCYFDYYQGDARREPLAIGGFVPLEKAYGYEPVPKGLAPGKAGQILGAQASLWTEYISTPEHLEYMTFPRLLALSEAVWSAAADRDYGDFKRRLRYHLSRLDKQDVRFRIPEPDGLRDFHTTTGERAVVDLNTLLPGSQIYYTLDGSEPSSDSARYGLPFEVALQPDQKTLLNLIVVTPTGRRSAVYSATLERREYRAARPVARAMPGLAFALFDGHFTTVRDLGRGKPTVTGNSDSFDLEQFGRTEKYGIRFDGYLKVESDDYYRFAVESDDGAVLTIDDEVVVDNDGDHANRTITGYFPLRKGYHKLEFRYFQAEGGATLGVRWGAADSELRSLDGTALYH